MQEEIEGCSKSDLELRLQSKDEREVARALLYLTFNVSDYDWVQETVLKMVGHPSEDICGLAITCVGHIARIHSRIDKDRVANVFLDKSKDQRFSGRIEDAMDDIAMFT